MASPPRDVAFQVSPVAGQKRPPPSLLPAFEPLTSSPTLPRQTNRLVHASPSNTSRGITKYPTPVPTSSTFIPTSSPPQLPNTRRPGLKRTFSMLSERIPLAIVPTIELSPDGEPMLMGRSSNSSHYQLSTSKLISRVHVRAVFLPATDSEPNKVQVECTGWNGLKVHCQGKAWDLFKGDTFTSKTEDAEIMIDVQDARVLVIWPRPEQKAMTPTDSDGTWDSEGSPSRRERYPAPYTSPLRHQHRSRSPISPSPSMQATDAASSGNLASEPPIPVPVQVYEDEPSDEDQDKDNTQDSTQIASQPLHGGMIATSPASFSDNDEENDPIISSFGPFGANLDARMQNITTASPEIRRPLNPLKEESVSPQRPSKRRRIEKTNDEDEVPAAITTEEEATSKSIVNFAINHLMYSPLSATPLSILLQSIPAHLIHAASSTSTLDREREGLSTSMLQSLLEMTTCIGAVQREGKDAAGKRLESEYYYIPEQDEDEGRREVIRGLGIGGRGLRSCRKSHKQYFWRRPK